ncbi:type 2 isopentenyl-diphosphate Delta-isomerase [Paenibacillus sp. 598K]|uniref:type 2 isopentenyl-diphosphate Delta-isomerase n=1 Tax=Paenibacillus sp. 598K TaxID=1117987 RepID=UPI000FFAE834|nr:type 2 isopentenyl-diphosphate Delta-isomerase [Paenibacillus sp. 598K]GBF73962.1 type 2 isopentenyl-diphosphate Delta-isomerase [Paenibacillus sp. 598K]
MTEERNSHHEEAATAKRKGEHIRICLEEDVASVGIASGFEHLRFRHNALPELSLGRIDLSSAFLGKPLKAPLLVSSMTGGTDQAERINRKLAEAAEAHGWAMGLGSMRAAIEDEALAATFRVRAEAPTIPILANLGAVQLNYGYGVDTCRRAVELAEADGLVLHLNSMQEVFQPEGDTNFGGLLERIAELCRELQVPVGVKEVGWGIDGDTARRLLDAGVSFIDVAGAGGTSWSQVEKFRTSDPIRRAATAAFADWGISTVQSIREVREQSSSVSVIASGGLHSGVDAAKAIALGADLAGFGRALLPSAAGRSAGATADGLLSQFERIEFELRAAMFGIGAATIADLKRTTRLVSSGRGDQQ